MAFNPFTTFYKNQKFWMAAILLICMVTFVFCTGTRADMQEWLMRLFRGTGPTVVQVAGRNYSSFDLNRLRDERNAVNDFMRRTGHMTLDNLNKTMQKEQEKPKPADQKEDKKAQERFHEMGAVRIVLGERLRKPRWFEGGNKLDDLVEFKLWQGQADRLGIRLLASDVDILLRMEFFSPGWQYVAPQQLQEAWAEAGRGKEIGDQYMRRAVMEEFRVRMAKLATIEMDPGKFMAADAGLPIPEIGVPAEQRVPVTLAKLWDVYKEKRAEFDVTLIPVKAADFMKDVAKEKGTPDPSDLQKLFNNNHTQPFDPAKPWPSFQTPAEVKVEFLMADPTSPLYTGTAKATMLFEKVLPLIGAPLDSPLVSAARYGAFVAAGDQTLLEKVLGGLANKFDRYGGADVGSAHFLWPLAAYLAEREPRAVASLVGNVTSVVGDPSLGGAAAWAGFLAEPTVRHANRIEAAIAIESKLRTLPSAKVAAFGLTGEPLALITGVIAELKWTDVPAPAGVTITGPQAEAFRNYLRSTTNARVLLPLPIIEPELQQVVENRMAERWASRNLLAMKRLLDNNAKPEAVKILVKDFAPKYHLTHVVTSKFYSRYDIDQAPALKPLREAYDRYFQQINWFEKRELTPERLLKEGDFSKLFFDNESFASAGKYQVRPWPPDIRPNQMQMIGLPGAVPLENLSPEVMADVQKHMHIGGNQGFRLLDKAPRPMLFWRNDDKPAEFPKDLASARPQVVAAWEKEQARENKALPLAKKIAEELVRNEDFSPLLDAMAVRGRTPKIVLDHVAPWVREALGQRHREYVPYQLPKDTIAYPRKDMVQELLDLYDLQEPIQVKLNLTSGEPAYVNELNRINKTLFDAAKKAFPKEPQGHFVQVIPNEPMDTFYVAVVSRPPSPDARDFKGDVLKYASEGRGGRVVDSFVSRAQQQLAQSFHASIVQQLKDELGYELKDSEAHKSFDKDDAGG